MALGTESVDPPHDEQALKRYYAQRASSYEQIYQRAERQADLKLIRSYLKQAFRDRSVLDVACGTGFFTADYAANANTVVGIDSSRETLSVARAKNIPNALFSLGDAYRLSEMDSVFDAAFLGFFMSHVPIAQREPLIAQLHSRLAPGAVVVMLDNCYVEATSTPIAWRDQQGNSYQDRHLPDGSMHRVLKNYPERAELIEALGPTISTHWWMLEYYWVLQYRRA